MAEATAGTSAPAQQNSLNAGSTTVTQASTQEPQGSSTSAQAQNQEPLKASAIPDPKAFLENWRAKHGWKTAPKPSQSAPAAPTQASTAQPQTVQSGSQDASKEGAPKPAADPAKVDPDDLAARVAKFSREEREFASQREAFKAEQARAKAEREEATRQHEAKLKQAETVERAAKAIESGDIAGALKALKADVNTSAIALQLLEQLQKEDERPMSQAEVDRIVSGKLKAQEEERAKAEEAKRKENEEKQKAADAKALDAARDQYVAACTGVFSKEKYPFIAAHGLLSTDMVAYAESVKDEHGRIMPPEPHELLNHFETLYRTRAERAGWAPKPVEAPKVTQASPLSPSSMVQDSGGRLANPAPIKDLNAKREEMKRRLRLGGVQT